MFELGGHEIEIDLKRYTQEYQRIRTKITEKSSSVDGSISSTSVTTVESLSDCTLTRRSECI